MDEKKIGELLEFKKIAEKSEVWDNLAQAIFKYELLETDYKNNEIKYFLKTELMSEIEKDLENKLKNPASGIKLIVLTGQIGAGKSTFFNYLNYLKIPDVQHEESHNHSRCSKKRIFCLYNIYNDSEKNEDNYLSYFQHRLSDKINFLIYSNNLISREEEVTFFWEEMFNKMKKNEKDVPENMFIYLYKIKDNNKDLNSNDLIKKLDDIIISPNDIKINYSDICKYYISLWSYIVEKNYNGSKLCFPIIIDNIDSIENLNNQLELFYYLRNIINYIKGIIIITMRPETLERNYLKELSDKMYHPNNEITIDFIEYEPLKSSDVCLNRINNFIEKPDIFKKYCSASKESEITDKFSTLKSLFEKIDDQKEEFISFINNLFQNNIRNALIFCMYMVKIDKDFIKDFSIHKLKRALLAGKNDFYKSENNIYVQNLFRISDFKKFNNDYFIKLRILHYLIKNNKQTIGKLTINLHLFDYELNNIRLALNDLLEQTRQLIISGGKMSYNEDDFATSNSDIILITKIGKNYYYNLYKDLDYLEEVTLDTYPPESIIDIGKLYKDTLARRFEFILDFINNLFAEEKEEIKNFLKKYNDKEGIKNMLPDNYFFTFNMINNIKESMEKILNLEINKKLVSFELQNEYKELLDKIDTIYFNIINEINNYHF